MKDVITFPWCLKNYAAWLWSKYDKKYRDWIGQLGIDIKCVALSDLVFALVRLPKSLMLSLNTLGTRQNGRYFPEDIFKYIFFNENVWILIEISLNSVPEGLINNISPLVQIMNWRRQGDKTLLEPIESIQTTSILWKMLVQEYLKKLRIFKK